ncbi:phasin family protein [Aminobacter sp. HY435]|uniref:phasin family protein n=1 Tax=Aminobacter sp. HY435 TaxID=2970917 RepID=UPI0022B9981C|nr:TIGR01841 family phasin [Aminobacter sp. HY435]
MAKQPESESFMDMFAKFGRDLKLPAVDVDAIVSHHRKNLEALEKSVKAGASGASSLAAKQREMMHEALREITEAVQGLRAPGNPGELVGKQAEFAKRSFEAALRNAGEMAEIARKSSTESIEVLRERIRESMQEIRDSYDKKK